ncbi:mucin-2-like [Astatotilapia calliptera]|uniref:mucin-2-like n=1 Tax=Astatotilapia calliptera TaxID=8154 RepID=UPI000E400CEA|nr:mucin-2-like [Astatotilapia calliptera]
MKWRVVWLCFLAFSVANVIDIQAKSVYRSTCSTWGREHFKTFDGDVYRFPGMCEYKLVSANKNSQDSQTFSVDLKRNENHENSTISFVVVKINSYLYNISKDLVTLNEQSVKLPYYQAGVQLEKKQFYIKLHSQIGITVMWYNDGAVMVEIDDEYANCTSGLCGDFNGNSDLLDEGQQMSPIKFGKKWRTPRPNDNCEDPNEKADTSLEAENVTELCKEFENICKDFFEDESWSFCTDLIDPDPYIQACVKDMCRCSNLNDSCVCSTYSEFSRQCSHAGGKPPNWRTPELCAKHCPPTMVYDEYGSPCIDTCRFPDTSLVCEDHNIDGCFCPPGTVLDDVSMRGCIPLSECPCKHDKIYESNEVYQEEGKNCTCFAGKWSCESLQMHATCSVEEGSHITTFDGKDFTFHGDCFYTLAKVESKDYLSPKFTILVHLTQCSDHQYDTCLKTLKIQLNSNKNNAIIFTSEGRVKMKNGQEVTLPYDSGDISIFHASSFHIMLQTSFGLQVQIQHVPLMQVYVSLEQSYKEKTRGLCGNYNMMLYDDMKTPQGMVEGKEVTFGNSWKTDYTCKNAEGRLDDPCSLSMENEKYANHWCPLLRQPNSTFAQCHTVVDPEIYYKRCIYASCNCEKSEDCLCAVFSSYARACASKGVFLTGWRKNLCDKYTKNCPESEIFSYKHQRCQLTCRSLSSKMQSCTSDFLPVDGCSCPEDHYLVDKDMCVPMAKCPCYHNEETIEPGKTISIKDNNCVCTDGVLHCDPLVAGSSECPSPKEYFNCSTANATAFGLQCAPTCLNLGNQCDATDCKSGCLCPRGLVDNGKGSCVKENECPCQHGEKLYPSGEKIPVKCNTCTCKSGIWECTANKCPGTCLITGSGHYITFDQKAYEFKGLGPYVAVMNNCDNKTTEENFRIITENEMCESSNTICSRKIKIQLGRNEITLSKDKYEEDTIFQNGTEIQYNKRRLGFYLLIESGIGLTVIWDQKTNLEIHLEPEHSGKVCGQCGDFDGNAQNDFTTQGQLIVSNPFEFANSWKTSSKYPDVRHNLDTCTPTRQTWAEKKCDIIKKEIFKECHKKIDPLKYYENCVRESCGCDIGGDCECFCTAVKNYAQACAEAGVCVAWRTPEICPVFCDYYNKPGECTWHYEYCPPPILCRSCDYAEGNCIKFISKLEGCYPKCPDEKPIFDENTNSCVNRCEQIRNSTTTTATPTTTTPTSTTTPTQSTTTTGTATTTTPTSTTTTPTTTPTSTTTTTGTPTTKTPTSTTTPTQSTTTTGTPTTTTPTSTTTPTQSTTTTETPTTTTPTSTTTTTGTPTTTTPTSTTTPTQSTTTTGTATTTTPTSTTTTTGTPTTTTPTSTTTPTQSTTTTETPTTTTPISATTTQSTTTTGTPTTTTPTFYHLGNCNMAKCIGYNKFEIVPNKCPPIKDITCTNEKKPVLIYDEFQCCQHYVCDCECQGWGDPHYITFDGFYYSYQGSCTYVLMEEIVAKHHLKVYIDNVLCDPALHVSCPRSIIISYGSHVFNLTNHNLSGRADLEALEHQVRLKLPYFQDDIRIMNSGLDLVLEITLLEVVITFGRTGFSINLPYKYFGKNTQGHCGTCNNNKTDDCMLPGGQLVKDCSVMADHWTAKEIGRRNCTVPPPPPPPPPTPTPCKKDSMCELLKSSLFAECHPIISPENFYRGCIFDCLNLNKTEVLCTSLQTYASACAQAGICIYWRNHTKTKKWCDSACPSEKVYKHCGPANQPTCENNPYEPTMNFTTEGCFCPEGMILFSKHSNICVKTCGCLDTNGNSREFNERFELKCQYCTCEESTKSVSCKPKQCPKPKITECSDDGFFLINQTDPSDPCCSIPVCQCKPSSCQNIHRTCSIGETPVVTVPEGKCCSKLTCVPKKVCVHNETEYQPGSSVPGSVCQDCTCVAEQNSNVFKVICKDQECNKTCDMGYEYVKTDSDECCGKCEQTHCVVNINGAKQLLSQGETWSPSENRCDEYKCVKNGEILTISTSHTVCSVFNESNCQPGTIQTAANGCCKICLEKPCKLMFMKINITHNNCWSAQEVDMPYCQGSCNTYTMYSKAAAAMQHSCSCCKETSYSNRTVDLVCPNGHSASFTYMYVQQCGCTNTECTTAAGHHIRRKRSFTLL